MTNKYGFEEPYFDWIELSFSTEIYYKSGDTACFLGGNIAPPDACLLGGNPPGCDLVCADTGACGNGEPDPITIDSHKIGIAIADYDKSPYLADTVQGFLNQVYNSGPGAAGDPTGGYPDTLVTWTNLKEEFPAGDQYYYTIADKAEVDSQPPAAFELTSLPASGKLY